MLKNKTLTYISLFSSAGVGCFGFKQEGYDCIATNEFIARRLAVQKANHKCKYDSGYLVGDIKDEATKEQILAEIQRFKRDGNDELDVLIATPPCQGMSVANHKKTENEIDRNSLVVESIVLTKKLRPRFFVYENVSAFLTTGCVAPSGEVMAIGDAIEQELSDLYEIKGRIINFKNYGSNSSRTRTLVIGVRKDYEEYISPLDLFPTYREEKTLRDVIGDLPELKWDEIDESDVLHAFRTYPEEMRCWIEGLEPGQSAFDNPDPLRRPHKVVDGEIVPNVRKNADKYTRQYWDKVAPCIHTRNDQLASQNTIHPHDDRVFSLRELMRIMTIPEDFRWVDMDLEELNKASEEEKRSFYRTHEINIRQSIGEAVPTAIFRQVAANIKRELLGNNFKVKIPNVIDEYDLADHEKLTHFIQDNPCGYSVSLLSKIAEMANSKRVDTAAYYTNKSLLNHIYEQLPDATEDEIRILEPSVGVGNFLPFIFKKYEDVPRVTIDVVDIDGQAIETLQALVKKIGVPENVTINYLVEDFLLREFTEKYFLVIGNPPFSKVRREDHREYFTDAYNTDTTNLAALFLEKAIGLGSFVVMVLPKFVINTSEFTKTRELLEKLRLTSIYDFGEKGFKGVLIETVCIGLSTRKRTNGANKVQIRHATLGIRGEVAQKRLTSKEYPYWILYRNELFDEVASKLDFDKFTVFRDRQITNKVLMDKPGAGRIRVLKSRNVTNEGTIVDIPGYDGYIDKQVLTEKNVYQYFNNPFVYLVPNMTYNPRMIRNPLGMTVNGSLAVLVPKDRGLVLTDEQMAYYATDEYRKFYQIARNYQTRSLNIDATSVYFFGIRKDLKDE